MPSKEKIPILSPEWWDGRRVAIAGFMGILGCGGAQMKLLQLTQPSKSSFEPINAMISSGSHPFLGFVGAAVASLVFESDSLKSGYSKLRASAIVLGGTALNFGVEALQSLTIASPERVNFVASNNLPETIQDYAFALAGVALYFAIDRSATAGNLATNHRSLSDK